MYLRPAKKNTNLTLLQILAVKKNITLNQFPITLNFKSGI